MNRKLGRKKAHRDHTLRNLLTSLVLYEYVDTTEAKAKEIKPMLDRIIARNKKNDLAAKRRLFGIFFDRNAASKIINELIPRYMDRQSGFVKSYHLKNRSGDNAPMMHLELVDKKVFVDQVEEKTEVSKDAAGDNKDVEIKVKEKRTRAKKVVENE